MDKVVPSLWIGILCSAIVVANLCLDHHMTGWAVWNGIVIGVSISELNRLLSRP